MSKRRVFKLIATEVEFNSIMEGDFFVLLDDPEGGTCDVVEDGSRINVALGPPLDLPTMAGSAVKGVHCEERTLCDVLLHKTSILAYEGILTYGAGTTPALLDPVGGVCER